MRANAVGLIGLVLVAAIVLARGPASGRALLGTDVLANKAPFRPAGVEPARPRNALATDPILCTFPREAAVGSRVRTSGRAARWDPGLGCGEPGNLASAALPDYPPWLVAHALLPSWAAHGWLVVLHLALAMAGAFLLARERRAAREGALVAALVYGLSGQLSAWLELTAWTVAAAWLPWALLGVERGVSRPRWLALAGLSLGAACLGGHLQVAALDVALAFAWPLVVPGRARDRVRAAVLALVLGLSVGAARLVPAVVDLRESARERIAFDRWFDETASLHGARWALLVAPDLLGDPVEGTQMPRDRDEAQANPQELRFAPTVVALGLALAAATRRRGLALALAAAALLALAARSPLAWVLWRFFPGFGATTPTRILAPFPLLVGLLAAQEWDEVRRGRSARVALVLAVLAGLLLLEGITGFVPRSPTAWASSRALAKPLGLAAAGTFAALLAAESLSGWRRRAVRALLVGLVAFDGAEAVARWNPTGSPGLLERDPPALATVRALVGPEHRVLVDRDTTALDVLVPFGVRNAGSYGSSHPRRYARLVDAVAPGPTGRASRQWLRAFRLPPAWRDALAIRAVLVDPLAGTPTVRDGLARVDAPDELLVFANPTALPRARVVPERRVRVRPDEDAALALARDASFDPRTTIVVELAGVTRDPPPTAPSTSGGAFAASFERDDPEHVVVRARTVEDAWLVLADALASGWSATVDGVPAAIVPANVAFRAVRLAPGEHVVTFRYAPPGWPWAALVSLVAASGSLVALGTLRSRSSARVAHPGERF